MIQRIAEEAPPGFSSLGLSAPMLRSLKRIGYVTPSPIQAELIPEALDGQDVIGQAKTGTGKTASFVIPILEMLEAPGRGPQAIILAPTRELVQQIVAEATEAGSRPGRLHLRDLRRRADPEAAPSPGTRRRHVVVGTPGRVIDHIERGTLYLGDIFHVVLDEADRMLDIGFRPDIETHPPSHVPNPAPDDAALGHDLRRHPQARPPVHASAPSS